MKIGVIGPSEIAFRRFMPAIQKVAGAEYVGIAYAGAGEWFGSGAGRVLSDTEAIRAEARKAEKFKEAYGGMVFASYREMLESGIVDAVYVPLPPALHFRWAKAALEKGLHVLVEKPSTTSLADTEKLVCIARERELALHENYMFAFHAQLQEVADAIKSGEIGAVRMYRVDFGFPKRGADDFRYSRELGGGALLDCGGYALKYGDMLLDGRAEVVQAEATYVEGTDVEVFGSGVLRGADSGRVVQIAFGMDNDYRCSIDVWGSQGTLTSGRILTAPAGFVPSYTIARNGEAQTRQMHADDAFQKSIAKFIRCMEDRQERERNYKVLLRQQHLVGEFARLAGMGRPNIQRGGKDGDKHSWG